MAVSLSRQFATIDTATGAQTAGGAELPSFPYGGVDNSGRFALFNDVRLDLVTGARAALPALPPGYGERQGVDLGGNGQIALAESRDEASLALSAEHPSGCGGPGSCSARLVVEPGENASHGKAEEVCEWRRAIDQVLGPRRHQSIDIAQPYRVRGASTARLMTATAGLMPCSGWFGRNVATNQICSMVGGPVASCSSTEGSCPWAAS